MPCGKLLFFEKKVIILNMKILLTNDDGIFSEGLQYFAREFSKNHEVTVAAPQTEQSACGHGMSIHRPVRMKEADRDGIRQFAIDGTPADCVKFAAKYLHLKPDLVISGPNKGHNLGTDIMYSGTVGAAVEASVLGFPSIAVSCSGQNYRYDIAYRYLAQHLKEFLTEIPLLVWNINLPNVSADEEILGTVRIRQGMHEYTDYYEPTTEHGETVYYLKGTSLDTDEECDVKYCKRNFVTVTPLSFDLTRYDVMEKLGAKK